jgi:Uma2 family endonuclease
MATANLPARNGMVLESIDWRTYRRLLRIFAERPGIRLTYDRGALEIMSPLPSHEGIAYLLGRFVDTLTDELNLAVRAARCTTFWRKRKRRGLEPDNSYWIASEPQVHGKDDRELRRGPPPDLAIEVEVTHSPLDRLSIYAKLGVPEVWRFSEGKGAFLLLQKGAYVEGPSLSFPGLKAPDLLPFLAQYGKLDDTTLVRQFRAWVRQRIADGWK